MYRSEKICHNQQVLEVLPNRNSKNFFVFWKCSHFAVKIENLCLETLTGFHSHSFYRNQNPYGFVIGLDRRQLAQLLSELNPINLFFYIK